MGTRTFVGVVGAIPALFALAACQPAVSPEELLRAGDRIKPSITVTSHQGGEPFLEPTTTIRGTVTDAAKDDGTAGRLNSSSWAVEGSTAGGSLTLGSDGTFSIQVDTQGRATELIVAFTATDWNGNAQTLRFSFTVPKEMTSLTFERAHNANLPFDVVGTIDGTAIEVRVAAGTVRTALVASFDHTGAGVKVGSADQQSGVTGNDFGSTVIYTVVGRDNKIKSYTVSVVEVTADYGQAAAPSFDSAPGTYHPDLSVGLSTTTPGGVIYYTVDGNDPTASSTRYTGPIAINVTSGYRLTATVKAVAFAPGYTPSGVSTGVFTVKYPWEPQAYLKASNAEAGDGFGMPVAVSGDTAVVGAPGEDSNQTVITNGASVSSENSVPGSGAAYVFVRSGGVWSQQAYLKAPNAEADDGLGRAVAVYDDTIVVGASGEDSNQISITNGTTASSDNSASYAGAAYVFVRSGTTWIQQAYLKAPNAEASDGFGAFGGAVAIALDTVIVGAYHEDSSQNTITNGTTASPDNSASGAGAAYVFVRSGSTWSQQAYLKAPNAQANDGFGISVAISLDTVIVGAYQEDSNQTTITNGATSSGDNSASGAGAAYVFVRNGNTWSQQAFLKASNAETGVPGSMSSETGDAFGASVAVSGDTAVVGALWEDSSQTTITNGSTASGDNAAPSAGAVYVFVRSGSTWSQQAYLKAPNAEAGDWFGFPVAISGNTVVAGACAEDSSQTTITNGATASSDNSATNAGAAYVFFYE